MSILLENLFEKYLKENAKSINKELEAIFYNLKKEIKDKILINLIDFFVRASLGGKRLRGALILLGYELAGGKINQEIIKVAASYEIFQTAILSHDDIIDKSEIRRGQKSLYKALRGDHYGISQAITLADFGFFLTYNIISKLNFSSDSKIKAIEILSKIMMDTTLGEMLDIEITKNISNQNITNIFKLMRLKTAEYSFIGPLNLGLILGEDIEGETKVKVLKRFEKFGLNLGIVYQLQDDILGVFGAEDIIGKSNKSDIEEGKITLLYFYALKNSNKTQKQFLLKNYGKGKISKVILKQIQEIFLTTKALEICNLAKLKYISQAINLVPKLSSHKTQRALLGNLTEVLAERSN